MRKLKIKTKLILLFIIIKVIPLLLLSYIAIEGAKKLNIYFEETTQNTFNKSKDIIKTTASTAISDSIEALDNKSQFALERLSYETANNVASFLYERDKDLLFLSSLPLNQNIIDNFRRIKTSPIVVHEKYFYDNDNNTWKTKENKTKKSKENKSTLKDNEKKYNINNLNDITYKTIPIYKEIQFIGLDGKEIFKSSSISKEKKNIKYKKNTYINSEDYFSKLEDLNKGDIYVSNVIGEYIKSNLIGTFTKGKATKMGIDFDPRNNAYAGKENPLGEKFEGILRFATPVYKNNNKIGYISFALDHQHIMEFTDTLDPLSQSAKHDIADASSGNYAFMWDNKGRNISHPRDYFIVGYDKKTGQQVPGWTSVDVADKFKNSKEKDLLKFLEVYPTFENQSLDKKPNMAQFKGKGEIALDCRYLNFAPQCQGWMDLTKDGSYGSFVIFWSGVWKLTTAAAIPYYTGQYGKSKRGFGFVTIGANVDEFHLAANKTKENIDVVLDKQVNIMKKELDENKFNITNYIDKLTNELTIVTIIMLIIVIAIAIWMSNIITNKIQNLLKGTNAYSKHNFNYQIDVTSKDEIGELEHSFNNMANNIKTLIDTQQNTNLMLDIKVQEANSATKAKSDFLASMSHEIRTPLNAILGFVSILKEQENKHSNLEYYRIIESSGENLIKIINDILDFSKIESNHLQKDQINTNLYLEIDTIIKQFTKNKNDKDLLFDVSISNKLSQNTLVDLSKITQVINNLISNAIKFSCKDGNIVINVNLTKKNSLYFSIENDGESIAKDKQEMIFNSFTQEDNTTTRKYGGTGLGLTISKRLIEFMNGTLKIDKNKEAGAKFYFEIPLSLIKIPNDEQIHNTQDIIDSNISSKNNFSILIVEDNHANQMFLKVIMKKLAINFDIANNGQEAINLYKTKKFDLIFMDENMPVMSGSDATQCIRNLEKTSKIHTPIIALTANALDGEKERLLNIGMDEYLTKPVTSNSIKGMILKYS